ncbi:MAG TPA: metal-dependent hydrolase, partial [Phycisphaerae bacterium]|nr:metal-dependent hydrolase [Phycisphaerae bacterium]
DKILFGSDWPWNNQQSAKALLAGLALTEKETRAIGYSNAARLLGM